MLLGLTGRSDYKICYECKCEDGCSHAGTPSILALHGVDRSGCWACFAMLADVVYHSDLRGHSPSAVPGASHIATMQSPKSLRPGKAIGVLQDALETHLVNHALATCMLYLRVAQYSRPWRVILLRNL